MSKQSVKYHELVTLVQYCPSLAKRLTEEGKRQVREIQAKLKEYGIEEKIHLD